MTAPHHAAAPIRSVLILAAALAVLALQACGGPPRPPLVPPPGHLPH
jgi:hypothetical protein